MASSPSSLLLPQYANRWVIHYVMVQFILAEIMQRGYLYLYINVELFNEVFLLPWITLASICFSLSMVAVALYQRLNTIGWHIFELEGNLRDNLRRVNIPLVLQLSALVIIINLGFSTAIQYFLPSISNSPLNYNIPWHGGYLLLQALVLACFVPVLEEFLFRGYILQSYLRHGGHLRAIIFSSLIFMTVHLNLSQLGAAFTIGIILASRVALGTSLLNACLIHSLNNAYALLASNTIQPTRWQALTGLCIATFSLLGFIVWVYQQYRSRKQNIISQKVIVKERSSPSPKARFFSIPLVFLMIIWILRMVSQVIILVRSS